MDIADQSSNAILRPGKPPRWMLVSAPNNPHRFEASKQAQRSGAFGADIKLVSAFGGACCGAIFVANEDGTINQSSYARLEYFFERDKSEALVFEYDRFCRRFFARRLEELKLRTIQ